MLIFLFGSFIDVYLFSSQILMKNSKNCKQVSSLAPLSSTRQRRTKSLRHETNLPSLMEDKFCIGEFNKKIDLTQIAGGYIITLILRRYYPPVIILVSYFIIVILDMFYIIWCSNYKNS